MFFTLHIDATFIQDWICKKTISALDIAMTNKALRPIYLHWLSGITLNICMHDKFYDKRLAYWIVSRRINIKNLSLVSRISPLISLVPFTKSLEFKFMIGDRRRNIPYIPMTRIKNLLVKHTSVIDSDVFFSHFKSVRSFSYQDHLFDDNIIPFISRMNNDLEKINISFSSFTIDNSSSERLFNAIGSCSFLKELAIEKLSPQYFQLLLSLTSLKRIERLTISFSSKLTISEKDVSALFDNFLNVKYLQIQDDMFYLGTIIRKLSKIEDIEICYPDDTIDVEFQDDQLYDGTPIKKIVFEKEPYYFNCDGPYSTEPLFKTIGIGIYSDFETNDEELQENIKETFDNIFEGCIVRHLEYQSGELLNYNFLQNVDHICISFQNHLVFECLSGINYVKYYDCSFSRTINYSNRIHEINKKIFSSIKHLVLSSCYLTVNVLRELFSLAYNLKTIEVEMCILKDNPTGMTVNDLFYHLKTIGVINSSCDIIFKN